MFASLRLSASRPLASPGPSAPGLRLDLFLRSVALICLLLAYSTAFASLTWVRGFHGFAIGQRRGCFIRSGVSGRDHEGRGGNTVTVKFEALFSLIERDGVVRFIVEGVGLSVGFFVAFFACYLRAGDAFRGKWFWE